MKNTIVIKLGGHVVQQAHWIEPLMMTIKLLHDKGYSIVLVHGGGPQADEMQKKLGIPIKKVNGRRITDKATLNVVKMVYGGLVNKDLVALAVKLHVPAVGISGIDAQLALCTKRKAKAVDFGYVGDIVVINSHLIKDLLTKDYVPIVSCLGADESGQILNINADSLATALAVSMSAHKLIFVTDILGVTNGHGTGSYFKKLSINKAKDLIKSKKITNGMIPKIENVEAALVNGVKNVQIVGALETEKQWLDAFMNKSYGTVFSGGDI